MYYHTTLHTASCDLIVPGMYLSLSFSSQERGNRMTEQNLGLIMGPNILHKEVSN